MATAFISTVASASNCPVGEVQSTWQALVACVEDTMGRGHGMHVPGLGRLTFVKKSTRDVGPGLKKAVFVVDAKFMRNNRERPGQALLAPCLELNFSKLAMIAGLDKDRARTLLDVILKNLGRAVAAGKPLRLPMGRVGALQSDGGRLSFKFSSGAVPREDSRGRMGQSSSGSLALTQQQPAASARSSRGTARGYGGGGAGDATGALAAATGPLGGMLSVRGSGTARGSEAPMVLATARSTARSSGGYGGGAAATAALGASAASEVFPRQMPFKMTGSLEAGVGAPAHGNTSAIQRNIQLAFQRLETKIQKDAAENSRHSSDIQARQEVSYNLDMERRSTDQARRTQVNAFLVDQAEEQRKAREREAFELLHAEHPDPAAAYPMARQLDLAQEKRAQLALKSALDTQVVKRLSSEKKLKSQEVARDRFLLETLDKELQDEREAQAHKKSSTRTDLTRDWDRQKRLGESLRHHGTMARIN